MGTHIHNPSTQEVETGGLPLVQGRLGLHSKSLFQKKKKKERKKTTAKSYNVDLMYISGKISSHCRPSFLWREKQKETPRGSWGGGDVRLAGEPEATRARPMASLSQKLCGWQQGHLLLLLMEGASLCYKVQSQSSDLDIRHSLEQTGVLTFPKGSSMFSMTPWEEDRVRGSAPLCSLQGQGGQLHEPGSVESLHGAVFHWLSVLIWQRLGPWAWHLPCRCL